MRTPLLRREALRLGGQSPTTPDPQTTVLVASMMGVGWTMYFSGLKKHLFEPKRGRRACPSCGRHITGRT
jgi:hypothetical protein